MADQVDPDTYDRVLDALREHPIINWACDLAGVSRQSLHTKRQADPEYDFKVRQAKAEGQRKRIGGASDERVLSWSDRETFGLRHELDATVKGVSVTIGNPAGLGIPIEDDDATQDDPNE